MRGLTSGQGRCFRTWTWRRGSGGIIHDAASRLGVQSRGQVDEVEPEALGRLSPGLADAGAVGPWRDDGLGADLAPRGGGRRRKPCRR